MFCAFSDRISDTNALLNDLEQAWQIFDTLAAGVGSWEILTGCEMENMPDSKG